ncbi:excalibur calcium-binding domain-containing protein [Demequina subtropica]|uniref:excalibur calcium-binding domain-containing protein n=1 Tax=Demequina subtropica TaxID=1638989 RepID=UPI000785990B|nr:excalibur calcium-binding domain-containing protein [Demequina subtropica]
MALPRRLARLSAPIVAAAILAAVGLAPAGAAGGDAVDIPGGNLEGCLRGRLGISSPTPLTQDDLASLTSLSCGLVGDGTLEGLQYAVNLESLSLTGTFSPATIDGEPDADAVAGLLEPLRELTSLQTAVLSFSGGVAFSLEPLSELPALTSLQVQRLPEDGVESLLPAPALTDLQVSYAWPSIDGIDHLTDLTSLWLRNVPASTAETPVSLTPLAGLTKLADVTIEDGGDAGDLTMFATMPGLTSLALDGVAATSLAGLGTHPLLTTLEVSDAGLSSLAGVEAFAGLTSIDVHGNGLTDISPLAGLTALATVNVNANHLTDISALGSLTLSDYSAWGQTITVDAPVSTCAAVTGFTTTDVTGAVAPLSPVTGYPDYARVGVVDGSTMVWTVPGTHTVTFNSPGSGSAFFGTFTVTVEDSGAPCPWHSLASIAVPTKLTVGTAARATVTWSSALHPAYKVEWVDARGAVLATGTSASTDTWAGQDVRARIVPSTAGFDTAPLASTAVHAARTLPTTMKVMLGGTAIAYETLVVREADRPVDVSLTYRWYRDGVRITGQAKHYYTLTKADAGHTIKVVAHASDTYGRWWPKDLTSNAVTVNSKLPFTFAPEPVLPTKALVGTTLRADNFNGGVWTPKPTSFSYQWYRDGKAISGATRVSYTVTSADAGHKLSVRVTARRSGYIATHVWSGDANAGRKLTTAAPRISGTAAVRSTVKATTGTWGPGTVSLVKRWYVNGKLVHTGASYTPSPRDAFKSLQLKVTGSKTGYFTVTRASTTSTVAGIKYSSCAALRKDYPGGVAQYSTTKDKVNGVVAGGLASNTFVSAKLYALNAARDGDKDGWACEP